MWIYYLLLTIMKILSLSKIFSANYFTFPCQKISVWLCCAVGPPKLGFRVRTKVLKQFCYYFDWIFEGHPQNKRLSDNKKKEICERWSKSSLLWAQICLQLSFSQPFKWVISMLVKLFLFMEKGVLQSILKDTSDIKTWWRQHKKRKIPANFPFFLNSTRFS